MLEAQRSCEVPESSIRRKHVKVSLDKPHYLILDCKYMFDNKFNQEQYNCIPNALSVYSGYNTIL